MEAGKDYLADASRMALYRDHCGHICALSRETAWLFSRTTADTNKAIPLDKRAKMA